MCSFISPTEITGAVMYKKQEDENMGLNEFNGDRICMYCGQFYHVSLDSTFRVCPACGSPNYIVPDFSKLGAESTARSHNMSVRDRIIVKDWISD